MIAITLFTELQTRQTFFDASAGEGMATFSVLYAEALYAGNPWLLLLRLLPPQEEVDMSE